MKAEKLAEKLRRGQSRALPDIIDIYTPYAYTVIKNIFGGRLSEEDIEDCLSECFITLWENRLKIQPAKIKAYIAAIARSKALDKLKANKITLPIDEDILLAQCEEPENRVIINELAALTHEAVNSLGEPDSEIFRRRYFLMQSCDDIAAAIEMNPSTVRTRLSRGLSKLRKFMREKGYDNENSFD